MENKKSIEQVLDREDMLMQWAGKVLGENETSVQKNLLFMLMELDDAETAKIAQIVSANIERKNAASTEGKRIKNVRMALNNLTIDDFCNSINVNKKDLAEIEDCNKEVPEELRKRICKEFNVSYGYLCYGEGDIFIEMDEEDSLFQWLGEVVSSDDSSQKRVLYLLMKLNHKETEEIERHICGRLEIEKKINNAAMTECLRIEAVRENLGLTPDEFYDRINCSVEKRTEIMQGWGDISEELRKALIREFNVGYDYLVFDDGEMFVDLEAEVLDDILDMLDCTDADKKFIKEYWHLNEETKKNIFTVVFPNSPV